MSAADRNNAFKVGKSVARRTKSGSKRSRSIRTFNLDDDTYKKFKRCCAEKDLKMSSVVDDLIRGYLAELDALDD